MSGLVSAEKVSSTRAVPADELFELMYCSPSMPFMFCSMTCVTESSMVLAEAPG